ncbi:MAG TPA: hypothetical protein VGJ87_00650 [Roseiflexaceae bacterium]|jgi:hypothetical protein
MPIEFEGEIVGQWPLGRGVRRALPWVGLLLVYILSSLTTDSVGRAPTQRNLVFGRLSREHSFGQTFVVERDDLVALRVFLLANPTDRGDPIMLRLRYADPGLPFDKLANRRDDSGAAPDLAVAVLPMRALARGDYTTFAIPPLTLNFPPGVVTTTLLLDLQAPTLAPLDWVTVMAGPDTYPGGELFAGGDPRPAVDLAFQPVYRRRWFDILLPISRMAHGKPGVLGWPQLYALLAYAYCIILVRVFAAVRRVVQAAVDAG